jgi:hypothetical protein
MGFEVLEENGECGYQNTLVLPHIIRLIIMVKKLFPLLTKT